nr:xanthine dehydrogenase family protein molybdopterin-binding subunit [uncultured Dyadobacter sp.]
MEGTQWTRRNFIQTTALASGGLLLSFFVPTRTHAQKEPQEGLAPNALLRIDEHGSVHIVINKVEMGQGIWTTLPMLIAEELDCDWTKIQVRHRDIGPVLPEESIYVLSTGGSDSTRSEFDRYRTTGAIARTMLVQAAAARMGVSPDQCQTGDGYVLAGNRRLSYGSLAQAASRLPVPAVTLRPRREWKLIGRSPQRLDIPDKINGRALYGTDIRFPGLLTAVLERCPVFGGTVRSFDASKSLAIPGVSEVIQVPAGVAVVADNYWSAMQGRRALQVVWDTAGKEHPEIEAQMESYRQMTRQPGITGQSRGNTTTAWPNAVATVECEYSFPYLAHAPMETLNCTVKLTANQCELWTGTQSPSLHRQEVADFLGFNAEQVMLHTPFLGGSFGRRGSLGSDWVMEAVHIARATGKPIKFMWSREDDIRGGFYRPTYLHAVKAGLNAAGFPVVWEHHVVGQSLFVNTVLEKDIAPNGLDYSSLDGVNGSPYLAGIPDHAVHLHTTSNNVPVLPLRSVGNTHTAFVMETLIDELADRAGMDPVVYRKNLLANHPRHLAALTLAADKAAWDTKLPAGRFRGVAVHGAMGSVVAQVMEISMQNDAVRVHRVVCAIACGLAVNPDGVVAQMESGIVYGLTAALYGEITFENGAVKQSNFHDYRMLRMEETPDIEVHIIEDDGKMGGAGEPGVAPVAPALANALFAASGKRIRKLPLLANLQ